MKKVTYLGTEYEVPDWVKFIAADDDGCIWAFTDIPDRGNWGYMKTSGECIIIGFIGQARYPVEKVQ